MMPLIQAIELIHGHAITAGCEQPPALRIIFNTPQDHAKFDNSIGILVEADEPLSKKATLHGSDRFEIVGISVEICNRERGLRVVADRIIAGAEKALSNSRARTITAAEILALRHALGDLLKLVRG